MGKIDDEKEPKNKHHKTLRDKLRKKREQIKNHKKQKRIKHGQYDAESKKADFFQQKNKALKEGQVKQKKLVKRIGKFINIYQDDIEDFFEIFLTFDKKGQIDISEIENKSLQKCLKRMFKHLPLSKTEMIYSKKEKAETNLQAYMRSQVSGIIQDYLENGTQSQKEDGDKQGGSSSDQELKKKKVEKKKVKKVKAKAMEEEEHEAKGEQPALNEVGKMATMGPLISAAEREMIAQAFAAQMQQQQQAQQQQKQEEDQFNKIFSMSSKRGESKPRLLNQQVPAQLLATGSAQIGQKAEVDEDYLQKYNKEFRPRKLIDQHREMLAQNKVGESQGGSKERKPFDRDRDIVHGRQRQHQIMNNSVFFDFKDRMTKSKTTNSFL